MHKATCENVNLLPETTETMNQLEFIYHHELNKTLNFKIKK